MNGLLVAAGNSGTLLTSPIIPSAVFPNAAPSPRLTLENGETLRFNLPQQAWVILKIFDSKGQVMFKVLDETRVAGDYVLPLPGKYMDSYAFLDFQAGSFHKTLQLHP
jgi:hypothetical protein